MSQRAKMRERAETQAGLRVCDQRLVDVSLTKEWERAYMFPCVVERRSRMQDGVLSEIEHLGDVERDLGRTLDAGLGDRGVSVDYTSSFEARRRLTSTSLNSYERER